MSSDPESASGRVEELRRVFDASFAAPPPSSREEFEDLLYFRVRGDAYALRVRQITAVALSGRVVPFPSRTPELLGIAGHRGALVPVYSLVGLLGYEPGRETPRWLALLGDTEPLALALGELEGFRRVARGDLQLPGREPGKHVSQFVRSGPDIRAVLDVVSISARIRNDAAPPRGGGPL